MSSNARIEMHLDQFYGENVDMRTVLDGLKRFKSDLEALGCEVSIVVKEIYWGDGDLPVSMTVDMEPAPSEVLK